ncbi:P-loop containing nucleoside triphosphate hydrolase protein [Mycena pura]|uniref:P-loop containing nucleoside triphosphate hydrolase protein n=1 Tax=Mycena pura TaxID=153505 RepID=A0AAD6Y132_9AGAR|nr:P-loop containing nucleoside triphosphate hydrolase protein [Mycena pura]
MLQHLPLHNLSFLGDGGVGTTALASVQDSEQTYDPTIEDSLRKCFLVGNHMCLVEVIDTAGQEEYEVLRDQWVLPSRCSAVLVLIGNKCDKSYDREVSQEEGYARVRQLGCEFVETSAKTAHNIDRVFASVVRMLRERNNLDQKNDAKSGRKKKMGRGKVTL